MRIEKAIQKAIEDHPVFIVFRYQRIHRSSPSAAMHRERRLRREPNSALGIGWNFVAVESVDPGTTPTERWLDINSLSMNRLVGSTKSRRDGTGDDAVVLFTTPCHRIFVGESKPIATEAQDVAFPLPAHLENCHIEMSAVAATRGRTYHAGLKTAKHDCDPLPA